MDIKPLVLIVEDDKPICKFISVSLETQNYKCVETDSGSHAVSLVCSINPDIIILDLGLPDIDGIEVIEKIRDKSNAKIIVVSARDRDRDKVEALDKGADDYLTKPFSVPELLARIRVGLRNINKNTINCEEISNFKLKELEIDFEKHKVYIRGESIHLTPIEYKLLELMSKYRGRVLTHRFIIKEIWGSYCESETRSLRVFMASIRRKIEVDHAQPEYIITEVGVGYRLVDE
ncbi:response regulator transcription factor [Romboutsia lituseburensis]|uniref:response regulator transcription factor n=1 Tax=Romboutsia lituseburensis TaxID=1537 RepID=UPI00215A703C|nr:response regulator transcription factor [Romboutsia lituseburensis]MCR8744573.1 response regulator transcription factor [Romboutsia lituseburensis]